MSYITSQTQQRRHEDTLYTEKARGFGGASWQRAAGHGDGTQRRPARAHECRRSQQAGARRQAFRRRACAARCAALRCFRQAPWPAEMERRSGHGYRAEQIPAPAESLLTNVTRAFAHTSTARGSNSRLTRVQPDARTPPGIAVGCARNAMSRCLYDVCPRGNMHFPPPRCNASRSERPQRPSESAPPPPRRLTTSCRQEILGEKAGDGFTTRETGTAYAGQPESD